MDYQQKNSWIQTHLNSETRADYKEVLHQPLLTAGSAESKAALKAAQDEYGDKLLKLESRVKGSHLISGHTYITLKSEAERRALKDARNGVVNAEYAQGKADKARLPSLVFPPLCCQGLVSV